MKKYFVLAAAIAVMLMPGWAVAEEGVTDTEILIGAHHDLSGPLVHWSVPWINGIKMVFDKVNEAGGVHGRTLRYIYEDNRYDPTAAILATQKLMNRDRVFCFLSNAGTPTALATKEMISERKIPQMFPVSASSRFVVPHDRYSFLAISSYIDASRNLIKYLHEEKGYTRIALIYQDDELGAQYLEGITAQINEYPDCTLVATTNFKRGTLDFSSQVARVRRANPEVLIIGAPQREPVAVMREVRRLGWDVVLAGGPSSHDPNLIELAKNAGISADGFMVSTMLTMPYDDSENPYVREFYNEYVERYGSVPDQAAVSGYFSAEILVRALELAGPDLTREALVDSLQTNFVNYEGRLGIAPFTFTPTSHTGGTSAIIQQVRDGRFRTISDGYVDWTEP